MEKFRRFCSLGWKFYKFPCGWKIFRGNLTISFEVSETLSRVLTIISNNRSDKTGNVSVISVSRIKIFQISMNIWEEGGGGGRKSAFRKFYETIVKQISRSLPRWKKSRSIFRTLEKCEISIPRGGFASSIAILAIGRAGAQSITFEIPKTGR